MNADAKNDAVREWTESAPYWQKHASTIRKMFAPVTAALIEEAGITAGQRVLDVAGGAGEPSLTIAEVVGANGSVTFTDAIARMVSSAEAQARLRGFSNIVFHQCAADLLPFPENSFDVVVSRLGIMFFPDPLAALREMLRVTKPGGRLALAVWGKSEANPFSYLVTNVVTRYVQTAPSPPNLDAFRFAESGKLTGLLREANAIHIRERLLKFQIAAPIPFEGFWQIRSEISGTLREKLAGVATEVREAIKQDVRAASREFFSNNQMSFPAEMLIVSGEKAIHRSSSPTPA